METQTTITIYRKDLDYIKKLKDKKGLKNKSWVVKKIMEMVKRLKLEEEII